MSHVNLQHYTYTGNVSWRYYVGILSFFPEGKSTDPLDAGVAAGIKAGQDVLEKAKKNAAEEAKKAAEKAVKETLRITELPSGDGKKPKTRYIEEVNITEVVKEMNVGVHATLMQGWSATGT